MDAKEQDVGEKRVRQLLIDPLLLRGLIRPAGMTITLFEAMLKELAQRLAYMQPVNLMALEEQVAATPGGKAKDRFPIANVILEAARQIEMPKDDASPLVRAVFAHEIGQRSISEGWAPELLRHVKEMRRFPNSFACSSLREMAAPHMRRQEDIDLRVQRGESLGEQDREWQARRGAAIAKCQAIADLGQVAHE